ncbi:MAG: hypothetical protein QM496_19440 [Verrucomicrobiota bacterium]
MSELSNINPDLLHKLLLTLCYILIALGVLKIALYLLMTFTPGIWEKLIEKENAFYMRIGLLSKKGAETYKNVERSVWAKAFFGCGGLATILAALIVIAIARWMQTLTATFFQ